MVEHQGNLYHFPYLFKATFEPSKIKLVLAVAQITTGYGFSPWRGQIFEIFETKGPWNDLLNDLMNSTSPNRLVFLNTD